jgi:hypothetical protein
MQGFIFAYNITYIYYSKSLDQLSQFVTLFQGTVGQVVEVVGQSSSYTFV